MEKFMTMIVALILGLSQIAGAGTVVSWNSANQRGGDLNSAGTGELQYSALEAALEGAGHTVLPGISEITAENLDGVDLFFHGTSSNILSASEQEAISDFVENGGCVILEANSAQSERDSGDSLLDAFPAGAPSYGTTGGSNGATAGLFTTNDTWTTNGPVGDLRGLSFGSSITGDITVGDGVLVGTNGAIETMVEYEPYGPFGGRILVCGDPYGFNIFQDAGGDLYNANNQTAYLNFLESQLDRVAMVDVDVKGGSCPNPFNPKSRGVVPIAIVGSDYYDVADIDPDSIEVMVGVDTHVPVLEDHWTLEDSTEPPTGDIEDCYDCFDADDPANFNCDLDPEIPGDDAYCGDQKVDLVVYVDAQALAAAIAAEGGADRDDCIPLVLMGFSNNGVPIVGGDSILIGKNIRAD